MPSVIVVDSPPGMHEAVEPLEVGRHADLAHVGARAPRACGRARRSRPAGRGRRCRAARSATSRGWRGAATRRACATRATPSRRRGPRRRAATRSGSWKCVVASTTAAARSAGSSDLKMPEPTKTRLGAELHHQRGVGRRGDAAGAEQRHGQLALARRPRGRGRAAPAAPWRRSPARRRRARAEAADLAGDRAQVAHGLDDVAGARPRPWSGSSPRPRRCAAAPRRGSSRRRRTGRVKAHLSMWWASSAGVRTSDSSM